MLVEPISKTWSFTDPTTGMLLTVVRSQLPVSHSADSHRAGGLTSCSSADSHHAVDVSPDTTVAVLFYNVGIQQDGAR